MTSESDIVARLRAENADPRNWRRMYGEAADEIEALRADLNKAAKLAYSAVRAERAAIVAFIDRHKKQRVLADSIWDEGYEAALDSITAGIKARGEI
jgi:hypothetical protein